MADPANAIATVQSTIDGSVAAAGGAGTVVLGWFAWIIKRAFGVTIPRLSHDFKEALAVMAKEFREALAEQRTDFREEMRLQRTDFKDELKQDRADLQARLDKLTTAVERMDGTLRQRAQ